MSLERGGEGRRECGALVAAGTRSLERDGEGRRENGALVAAAAPGSPVLKHGPMTACGKGAVESMTRSLAVELAKRNPQCRVNAILPGPAMLPDSLDESARRAAIAGTLVQRAGSPEAIAHAVQFLMENDFATGVCLPVDGGRTIAPQIAG
ncbi:MAG: SDR family oxidoreductase [Pirellulaceae bacterium]|nr:SDR family oxidoreductase [Pirellulaceae bacterium]